MLPSSLRKFSKAFNVERKGYFPFDFINDPSIPLDYNGSMPDFNLFEGITNDDYQAIITNNWNLKQEVIK